MRSVDEAVILVTGSTDGLGKSTARDLAAAGATVLLHGRDPKRGDAAAREISEEIGNDRLHYYVADFSSLEEVRWLVDKITADHDRLDVLVNNAGIGAGRRGETSRDLSRDGYELRFTVNYLAPFLLTRLLLPLVRRAAPSRIVNVASAGQSQISFDDVMLERGYDGMRAYTQSKLALVMFTFDLAEELEDTGVTANSLHPASLMNTKMVFETFGSASTNVREGTDATVRLAISPDLERITGRYFDGQREARADEQAYDPEARGRLRRLSEELTGLRASDRTPPSPPAGTRDTYDILDLKGTRTTKDRRSRVGRSRDNAPR